MTAPTPERRVGERLTVRQKLDAIGIDASRDHDAAIHEALDRLSRLTAEVERLTGIELKYRKSLWMGHGHDHLYGDDGEMQCTQCPGEAWDYRRAPLEVIERAAWFARTTSLPTPAPEATE